MLLNSLKINKILSFNPNKLTDPYWKSIDYGENFDDLRRDNI